MKIASNPEQYTGAYGEVIFTVTEINPGHITEVRIFDTSNTLLAKKRFNKTTKQNVSTGRYATHKLSVKPVSPQNNSGFYSTPDRMFELYIRALAIATDKETGTETIIQDIKSETIKLTAGAIRSQAGQMMSGNNSAVPIYPGECDEIPIIAGTEKISAKVNISRCGKEPKTVTFGNTTVQNGRTGIFLLNPPHLYSYAGVEDPEEVCGLELEISTSNRMIAQRRYIVQPDGTNTVRCAWLNKYGGIDSYTFKAVQNEILNADKKKVYGMKGYTTASSQAETIFNAVSEALTRETYDWLSNIICSPNVWMMKGEEFVPIDIISEKAEYTPHKISRIGISFREAERQEYQRG